VLIGLGLMTLGIKGVAIAFFILYLAYTAGVYGVARHLTGFCWSAASRRLLLWLLPMVAVTFIAARLLPLWPADGLWGGGYDGGVGAMLARLGATHRRGTPGHPGDLSGARDAVGVWVVREGERRKWDAI